MARLIISAFAAAILLATATGVLRSHSLWSRAAGGGGMPSLQKLQGTVRTERLPVQDFEDRSLEFPRQTKQN
jgi:hypothetical protein